MLTSGRLGIIVVGKPAGRGHQPGRSWGATSLEVGAAARIHAGLDGEAVELDPPLRFEIQPGALQMRVPRSIVRAGEAQVMTAVVILSPPGGRPR